MRTGALDPTVVITHVLPLDAVGGAYKMFNDKVDGCIKVTVL